MDLGALISQSATRLRRNWVLIVPPILTQVVVPLAFLAAASFTLFPLLMAFSLTGDTSGLVQTIVVGALLFAIGILLLDSLLTAGWAYMNKRVVIDGRVALADLWLGAKKYFIRILVGRIIVGVILVLPAVAGIVAVTASILTLDVGSLMPPEGVTPATLLTLLAPIIFELLGIVLVVGLVEIILYIFLFLWMQALVMEDLKVMQSIRSSFVFSRRNFSTMIGYIVMLVIAFLAASWAASFMWPDFSYTELSNPTIYSNSTRLLELMVRANNIVYYVISAILSAFFTLLLFGIYADRPRGPQTPTTLVESTSTPIAQAPELSPPPRKPKRGTKYCANCGAQLIMLAVFCPNCGARQPPLQLE
jgi:hypothetical protein